MGGSRQVVPARYTVSRTRVAPAVDGFLTDEFGGTNFPLIHAVLQGPRIIPTPRLIVDYARNGHLSPEEARTLIATISPHRSWENSPDVTQLLQRLEA